MGNETSQYGDELSISVRKTWNSTISFNESWAFHLRQMGSRRLLIADANLASWIDDTAQRIQADHVCQVHFNEQNKSLKKVHELYEWLEKVGASRDVLVVAMGGGVCTDVVGLAASTYLRGVAWAAIPTSLLAQVDASIGGKVGVNTDWGKNLVGAFYLPEFVAIDTRYLATLPTREWRAGLGEVMKCALLQGGWLYRALDRLALHEGAVGEWAPIVREAARIKVELVNRDFYETGSRMYLNLGHTVGHALEALMGFGELTHGEAVGLGTLAALRLSERLCGLSSDVRQTVLVWMSQWGLPTKMPALEFPRVWEQLHRDKKVRAGGLTWVLLDKLGSPRLVPNINAEVVRDVLAELAL